MSLTIGSAGLTLPMRASDGLDPALGASATGKAKVQPSVMALVLSGLPTVDASAPRLKPGVPVSEVNMSELQSTLSSLLAGDIGALQAVGLDAHASMVETLSQYAELPVERRDVNRVAEALLQQTGMELKGEDKSFFMDLTMLLLQLLDALSQEKGANRDQKMKAQQLAYQAALNAVDLMKSAAQQERTAALVAGSMGLAATIVSVGFQSKGLDQSKLSLKDQARARELSRTSALIGGRGADHFDEQAGMLRVSADRFKNSGLAAQGVGLGVKEAGQEAMLTGAKRDKAAADQEGAASKVQQSKAEAEDQNVQTNKETVEKVLRMLAEAYDILLRSTLNLIKNI